MRNEGVIVFHLPRSGGTYVRQVFKMCGINFVGDHEYNNTPCKTHFVIYRDFRDVATSYWRITYGKYDYLGNLLNFPTIDQLKTAIEFTEQRIKGLNDCKNERANINIYLRYENFFNNPDYLFAIIESVFDLRINNKEEIKEKTSLETNKLIADKVVIENKESEFDSFDKDSGIHARHIYKGTPGLWKKIVPDKFHKMLNDRLFVHLKEWGYDISK